MKTGLLGWARPNRDRAHQIFFPSVALPVFARVSSLPVSTPPRRFEPAEPPADDARPCGAAATPPSGGSKAWPGA
ncbi:unnamed protein product [Urochloa humidicola]